ncbi:hypothetical protein F4781DRAFT_442024 [Annulohypoxylon bovei var. microspora]|nr:hypothetical protein F4781DRAFT_442024 [Annulohypoxylon bovei var. microspora]
MEKQRPAPASMERQTTTVASPVISQTARIDRCPSVRGAPDSGVDVANGSRFAAAMDAATTRRPQTSAVFIDIDGVQVSYTFDEITMMSTELATARAERRFPRTTAAGYDIRSTIDDFGRLLELNEARGTAPPEQWNRMPNVVELHVRIAQEIRARDKTLAEATEEERVKAHVNNLLSGVGAETRLYSIVQHAVTFAIKNDKGDEAASVAGQNMLQMLKGIRAAINQMADQRTHNIDGANVEAVLEEVFGMIDHALGQNLGERVDQMDSQLNTVNGQIMHLNAIGQHVNAIDGHVHSLGNNLNAMGTLLNSTNGNITGMTTQIALLQTIINMLPRLIAEGVEQMLPGMVETALGPIIDVLHARGVARDSLTSTGTSMGRKHKKKSIKSFFKGLFKRSKKSGY